MRITRLPGLSENHQSVPGLSENHQSVPGLSENHQIVPGLSENHQIVPGLSENHQTVPGLSENHQIVPGLSENHQSVPGLCDNSTKEWSQMFWLPHTPVTVNEDLGHYNWNHTLEFSGVYHLTKLEGSWFMNHKTKGSMTEAGSWKQKAAWRKLVHQP